MFVFYNRYWKKICKTILISLTIIPCQKFKLKNNLKNTTNNPLLTSSKKPRLNFININNFLSYYILKLNQKLISPNKIQANKSNFHDSKLAETC